MRIWFRAVPARSCFTTNAKNESCGHCPFFNRTLLCTRTHIHQSTSCYLLSLTKPTPLSTITQVTRDCAESPSPPRASHVSGQIFASSLALNYRRQNICTVGLVSFLLVLHRLCMRAFGTRQLFETQQVSFRTRNQWLRLILADIPPDGRAHNIDRMHGEAC